MVVVKGRTARMPHEVLRKTTWAFPHAFPEGEFNSTGQSSLTPLGANDLHMMAGDYAEALDQFCRMAGLDCEVIDKVNTATGENPRRSDGTPLHEA